MSFFSSLFGSKSVALHQDASLTKFFGVNNAPVNSFCNNVPVFQPSLISTTFGVSLLFLLVLLMYLFMYKSQAAQTGVESRLLISLIVGNMLFSVLSFNDWFNLQNQVVFCNEYKNGVLNLYQVTGLIENYKLTSLLGMYKHFALASVCKYGALVYKQFVQFFVDGGKEAYQMIQEWVKSQAH